jgi:glycolate oxidase iron-sulfur subunit
MKTDFSKAQLADPRIREANDIFRKCVHCGFCLATCPTFVLLGDELDSPRGRIYLIKDMLENDRPASVRLARHLDRCLTCLSCMTTCPSAVDYMHLIERGRIHVEETFKRPWTDRLLRGLLAFLLPRPGLFRLALVGGRLARPFKALFPGRLAALVSMAPSSIPAPSSVDRPGVFAAEGPKRMRVALISGCAQQVLRPAINEAAVRLLTRHGCEVVVTETGCCGALVQHMGRDWAAKEAAKANIAALEKVAATGPLDAVLIMASGCAVTIRDYGHMLAGEVDWAARAAAISAKTRDLTEVMAELGLSGVRDGWARPVVAYHSACSMQHGQGIRDQPVRLLVDAGFEVREPRDSHLCCGSAGTYNLLQPDIASRLGQRKAANLKATGAGVIATGNIGCLVQISGLADRPVVHTVELLDWATGGPPPKELNLSGSSRDHVPIGGLIER